MSGTLPSEVGRSTRGPTTEQVFAEHAHYVWRLLRWLGVAERDLEDVCQEVFVVVHRRLADFEGRSSVRTWLYGICIRTASDYRRRAHRRHESTVAVPIDEGAPGDQDHAVQCQQALSLLDRALSELDDGQRATYVLYELGDCSMGEIARILDCPVQTGYSRLRVARDRVDRAVRRMTRETVA